MYDPGRTTPTLYSAFEKLTDLTSPRSAKCLRQSSCRLARLLSGYVRPHGYRLQRANSRDLAQFGKFGRAVGGAVRFPFGSDAGNPLTRIGVEPGSVGKGRAEARYRVGRR